MGYLTTDEPNTRIFLQMGRKITHDDALCVAEQLSKLLIEPVGIIVNGPEGLGDNVAQLVATVPSIKNALDEYTYQCLNQRGPALIVLYGGGNDEGLWALRRALGMRHEFDNLSFLSLSSTVPGLALRYAAMRTQSGYMGQYNDWWDPSARPILWCVGFLGLMVAGAMFGMHLVPAEESGDFYSHLAGFIAAGLSGILGGLLVSHGLKKHRPMLGYINKLSAHGPMFDWKFRPDQ